MAAFVKQLAWRLRDWLGWLPWDAPDEAAEEDEAAEGAEMCSGREVVSIPSGWYVFVAGPTDSGPTPDCQGDDAVSFVVPAGGTWRAHVSHRQSELAASGHTYDETQSLSWVELYRDTLENRARPSAGCGSLCFEVPAGGALVAFEGGGDAEMQALDGTIELFGAGGWTAKFVHSRSTGAATRPS